MLFRYDAELLKYWGIKMKIHRLQTRHVTMLLVSTSTSKMLGTKTKLRIKHGAIHLPVLLEIRVQMTSVQHRGCMFMAIELFCKN